MRYFEDLNEGDQLRCNPVKFSSESIIEFGKNYDPQPFHINERSAKSSIFRGLVASALHTISACTRSVVEAQGEIAILSGVGMYEANMFNPVRPEDILFIEAWWSDLKRSKKKPERGFASIRCMVTNQRKEPVIEYGYRYLISCKPTEK